MVVFLIAFVLIAVGMTVVACRLRFKVDDLEWRLGAAQWCVDRAETRAKEAQDRVVAGCDAALEGWERIGRTASEMNRCLNK